jgi:O-methyltransferase domain
MTQTIEKIDMRPVLRLAVLADYIVPFAIRVVAQLGVADHLAGGPRHVDELAAATQTHPRALARTLRALAARDVFLEVEPDVFALTPMAEVLRSDHPYSLRDGYPLLDADVEAWAHFDYSVKTGKPAFDHVHGESYWSYKTSHPDYSVRFDRAMAAYSRLELRAVLPFYDWRSFDVLMDIGGGNGMFLGGLLSQVPELRGVLFDLPHVVAHAPELIARFGVADRCEIVPGSAFDAVPPGYAGYMLKRVLYDFDDERAVAMLRAIRKAMRPDSRLLILDPVIEPAGGYEYATSVDLLMLAMVTGYARTRSELEALLAQADLRMTGLTHTPNFPIVEARPK